MKETDMFTLLVLVSENPSLCTSTDVNGSHTESLDLRYVKVRGTSRDHELISEKYFKCPAERP